MDGDGDRQRAADGNGDERQMAMDEGRRWRWMADGGW